MALDLYKASGTQVVISLNEFAELLSTHQVWALEKRYYQEDEHPDEGIQALKDGFLFGVTNYPKMTKVAKVLNMELVQVNDLFEYSVAVSKPHLDDFASLTFTRQHNSIVLEVNYVSG